MTKVADPKNHSNLGGTMASQPLGSATRNLLRTFYILVGHSLQNLVLFGSLYVADFIGGWKREPQRLDLASNRVRSTLINRQTCRVFFVRKIRSLLYVHNLPLRLTHYNYNFSPAWPSRKISFQYVTSKIFALPITFFANSVPNKTSFEWVSKLTSSISCMAKYRGSDPSSDLYRVDRRKEGSIDNMSRCLVTCQSLVIYHPQ